MHAARAARKGFTLVELLVALGLIGLVIAAGLPFITFSNRQQQQADTHNRVGLAASALYDFIEEELHTAGRVYVGTVDDAPTWDSWQCLYAQNGQFYHGEKGGEAQAMFTAEMLQSLPLRLAVLGHDRTKLDVEVQVGNEYQKAGTVGLLNLTLSGYQQTEGTVGKQLTSGDASPVAVYYQPGQAVSGGGTLPPDSGGVVPPPTPSGEFAVKLLPSAPTLAPGGQAWMTAILSGGAGCEGLQYRWSWAPVAASGSITLQDGDAQVANGGAAAPSVLLAAGASGQVMLTVTATATRGGQALRASASAVVTIKSLGTPAKFELHLDESHWDNAGREWLRAGEQTPIYLMGRTEEGQLIGYDKAGFNAAPNAWAVIAGGTTYPGLQVGKSQDASFSTARGQYQNWVLAPGTAGDALQYGQVGVKAHRFVDPLTGKVVIQNNTDLVSRSLYVYSSGAGIRAVADPLTGAEGVYTQGTAPIVVQPGQTSIAVGAEIAWIMPSGTDGPDLEIKKVERWVLAAKAAPDTPVGAVVPTGAGPDATLTLPLGADGQPQAGEYLLTATVTDTLGYTYSVTADLVALPKLTRVALNQADPEPFLHLDAVTRISNTPEDIRALQTRTAPYALYMQGQNGAETPVPAEYLPYYTLSWPSSDSSVAIVDRANCFVAQGAGTAQIGVRALNGYAPGGQPDWLAPPAGDKQAYAVTVYEPQFKVGFYAGDQLRAIEADKVFPLQCPNWASGASFAFPTFGAQLALPQAAEMPNLTQALRGQLQASLGWGYAGAAAGLRFTSPLGGDAARFGLAFYSNTYPYGAHAFTAGCPYLTAQPGFTIQVTAGPPDGLTLAAYQSGQAQPTGDPTLVAGQPSAAWRQVSLQAGVVYNNTAVQDGGKDKNVIWQVDRPDLVRVVSGALDTVTSADEPLVLALADGVDGNAAVAVTVQAAAAPAVRAGCTVQLVESFKILQPVGEPILARTRYKKGSWFTNDEYFDGAVSFAANRPADWRVTAGQSYLAGSAAGAAVCEFSTTSNVKYDTPTQSAAVQAQDAYGAVLARPVHVSGVDAEGGGTWVTVAPEEYYLDPGESGSAHTSSSWCQVNGQPAVSDPGDVLDPVVTFEPGNGNFLFIYNYSNGLLGFTARHTGRASITVSSTSGNTTATLSVTVRGIALQDASVQVGDTLDLTAAVQAFCEPNNPITITNWASSNPLIATVGQDGLVTPRSPGQATLTATGKSKAGGVYTATCTVTVELGQESQNPASVTARWAGGSAGGALAFVGVPGSGPVIQGEKQGGYEGLAVYYTSADEGVATVAPSGLVAAQSVGSAQIFANAGTKRSAPLTVYCCQVQGVDISTPAQSGQLHLLAGTGGDTLQLQAASRIDAPAGAPAMGDLAGVTWASLDEDIATVDENGLVTARGMGTVLIQAASKADPSAKATYLVVVTF